jgi:choline kinase
MAKKVKKVHVLDDSTKKEIILYCRAILHSINKKYLSDSDIYHNEFLEYLYMGCKKAFELHGDFKLDEDDIVFLILSKKQADKIVKELEDGNAKFIGINKEDDLIFEFKNKEALINFNTLKQ